MAKTVADALSEIHEVTVLCGRPSYDPTERRGWKLWQNENQGRVKIIRVGSTDYPRVQMKRRILNYLSYVALAVPRALFFRCDTVLAMTDPPFQGIVGAFVALLKVKPYFYNIRDMYPDMAVGGAIVESGLLARVWEQMHRWALRRADRVVVLGDDMRARIIAKGVEASKIQIVRDGAEIHPLTGAQPKLDDEVIHQIRADFRFVLLHAGNLGFYGAWETLLAAARELAGDGVGFVFVGEGVQRAQLIAAAENCASVRFLPFFPASQISSVLAAADAHLITVKRGLEGVVVPSKIYGILAAGKPVIAVAPTESDVASLGKMRGFGISCDPDKPSELVSAVRALIAAPDRLQGMGEAARAAAPDFDRAVELAKFVNIFQ